MQKLTHFFFRVVHTVLKWPSFLQWNLWTTRIQGSILVSIILSTLSLSAFVHYLAGLTLPVPWSDETSFLWPAINFAQQNTFLAPELNPDRAILWMPPGYMLVLGLLLKIIPFSIIFVRWMSWIFLSFAYILIILWIRRYRLAGIAILLLSLFWLNGAFVCAGNIARMDGLLLFLVTLGFFLCARGDLWKGLPLLACSVLVHPNGIYFFAGAVGATLFQPIQWKRPSRADFGFILTGLLAWGAYGFYVYSQWPDFSSDMAMQFSRKADRDPLSLLLQWPTLGYLSLYATIGFVTLLKYRRYLFPVTFGFCAFFLSIIGHEMWYEIYLQLGFLFLAWLSLAAIDCRLQRLRLYSQFRIPLAGLLVIPLLIFFYRNGWVEGPSGYFHDLSWGWGMHTEENEVRYFTEEDQTAIWMAIRKKNPTGLTEIKLGFSPSSADQFLFFEKYSPQIRPFSPHFTTNKPDAWVVHESRHIPQWVAAKSKHVQHRTDLLYERSGTERWYWVDSH